MNTAEILRRIQDLRILVVGDICLDRWCTYDPELAEPSRETGFSRTAVIGTQVTPGAGGTIANNLRALGVRQVAVLGAIGVDGFGWELVRALEDRDIIPDLVSSPEISTFTYTKLINARTQEEDLGRVDFVNRARLPEHVEAELLQRLKPDGFDVVIVGDQAETAAGGAITPAIRDRIGELAATYEDKVFWVDSRLRIELFRNVIAKPNELEADQACHRVFGEVDYPRLRRVCGFRTLIVTHGDRGAEVIQDQDSLWADVPKVPVRDVCGAGDSFSAGAACALAVTGDAVEAARFGNLVASITVQKPGTGVATPEELLA